MTIRNYVTARLYKWFGVLFGLVACAAAVSASLAPLTARAETARPMMWVVKDADSTIYLFGSVHVMKAGVVWLTPELKQRFDSASDVWFEVADMDDTALMQKMAQAYMLDPSGQMTKGLTPEEVTRLDAELAHSGMSSQQLMGMRKWAVGLILVTQKMQSLGYDPTAGVDLTLLRTARASGKIVHGFETGEQQMQAIAPTDEAGELAALRESLTEVDVAETDLAALLDVWVKGDEAGLVHYMVDKYKAEEPESYQRLIVARNAAWEPQIEAILKGKGTAFITVGAGHLVGPDSVIAMLRQHGVQVERLN